MLPTWVIRRHPSCASAPRRGLNDEREDLKNWGYGAGRGEEESETRSEPGGESFPRDQAALSVSRRGEDAV